MFGFFNKTTCADTTYVDTGKPIQGPDKYKLFPTGNVVVDEAQETVLKYIKRVRELEKKRDASLEAAEQEFLRGIARLQKEFEK